MQKLYTISEASKSPLPRFSTILVCLAMLAWLPATALPQAPDTLFFENWEGGIGRWFASNGVWEVGKPADEPGSTPSGENCAGTILAGNYPANANTRLTSPQISLPAIASGEKLKLRFMHWFRMNRLGSHYDYGFVQISTDNGNTWQTATANADEYSAVWTQPYIDLSAYANSVIRIGFIFISSSSHEDRGWYIDDIYIVKGSEVFPNPEGFEAGIGDWSADNGLWQVGTPTAGPQAAHTGQFCAGTVLDGNYFESANTRLISPEITLTPLDGQTPDLFFWQWFRMNRLGGHYDYGEVQISVNGGGWRTIAGPYDEYNPAWSQAYVSLAAYADSSVRLAFYFESSSAHEDHGWYIDDIRIEGIESVPTAIDDDQQQLPNHFTLHQNYPNPFNPSTTIRYELAKQAHVTLTIHDLVGRHIATLVDEPLPAGSYTRSWQAEGVPSGVYVYRLRAGDRVETRKMVLMR